MEASQAAACPDTQSGVIPGYREDLPWHFNNAIAVPRSTQSGFGNAISNPEVSPCLASGPRWRIEVGCLALTTVAVILPMVCAGVFELRTSFLVPISGTVIGNAMNATALALERLQSDLRARRDQVEAWLSLGIDPDTATRPSAELSLQAALIPTMNSLKTTGIVHIPGTMLGMLLGGQSPVKAAEMQWTILVLVFVGALLSALLVGRLGRRLFFTELEALDLPG